MTDKENLKMGLEEISDFFFEMYRKETDQYKAIKAKEYSDISEDAISLLKEEAVKPTWNRGRPFCSACGSRIRGGKFCSECGKPILWEGR